MYSEESKNPLVTVLMPCYNAMPYLPEALESIMQQTYTNLEILCINDGSSDETPEVLERYAAQDKRIRVVHNDTNLKLIATLNKGIALAKGEYIARMDADDVAFAERIEEQVNQCLTNDFDFIGSNVLQIDHKGVALKEVFIKAVSNHEIAFSSYFFTPFIHPSVLGKRALFKKLNYAVDPYVLHTEDYEYWTRLVQENYKLSNNAKPLLRLRNNPSSVSHQYESVQRQNFVHCANKHQSKLLQREIDLAITAVAVNRMDKPFLSDVQQGLQLVDEITTLFIKRHPESSKSFKSIAAMQKVDIAIQLIRSRSIYRKLYGVCIFVKSLFFYSSAGRVLSYIIRK